MAKKTVREPKGRRVAAGQPPELAAGPGAEPNDPAFAEVLSLIQNARQRAYQAVNAELVDLYWSVGGHISRKLASAEWGDGVVADLARYLARRQPGLRGFSRQNLFRMRQFYDAYPEGAIALDPPPHHPGPEPASRGA